MGQHDQASFAGTTISCACSGSVVPRTVENAKRALKAAKAKQKADRKLARKQEECESRRRAAEKVALDALLAVCADERKYSSDARVAAAHVLLARTQGR
jgi:hypothetical protein